MVGGGNFVFSTSEFYSDDTTVLNSEKVGVSHVTFTPARVEWSCAFLVSFLPKFPDPHYSCITFLHFSRTIQRLLRVQLSLFYDTFSGILHDNLVLYYHRASEFNRHHPIHIHNGANEFNTSLLEWHTAYTALLVRVVLLKRYLSRGTNV